MTETKHDKENELVEHLLSKDTKRFALVFDYFSAALLGVINQIVKNRELAEDILQDVFLKIWNNSNQYDSNKSRLFTWVLNVARNTAIDYTRSKQGKLDKKNQPLDTLIYSQLGSSELISNHDTIGLKKLVNELKEDQKEIIDLAFFEGYTHVEIAEKLNIPLGTVKTKCRSAISVLRKAINSNNS